jgi:hypothetical protein
MEQREQGETRKEHDDHNGHHGGDHDGYDRHGHHEEHKKHIVIITVNDDPVKIAGTKATGRQIKEAAIAQSVKIDLGFVLSVEKGNSGHTKVVGDDDEVAVHDGLKFIAVAPDDNS